MISQGLKKPVSEKDILSPRIKVSHLKRIDKIFDKGLHYYLDPSAPETSREASIFFRKDKFNSELNIGAKKIVNHFEEFKISLSAIAKLAELKTDRVLPVYKITDDPRKVAVKMRELLYPQFNSNLKEFLKSIISQLAGFNILVFEFVETWNKKEKANIDGFFLNPNVIVLKRYQIAFRREIFTLIHELAHYLILEEEIEKIEYQYIARKNLSKIERWCNDFTYKFLAGDYAEVIDNIDLAGLDNDYHHELIDTISKHTHLSKIALFTRMLYQDKLSRSNYEKIRVDFEEKFRLKLEEEKRLQELKTIEGKKQGGSTPKPINSPLLVSTIQSAFYGGVISEYEVCKKLNIKPEKIDLYIQ